MAIKILILLSLVTSLQSTAYSERLLPFSGYTWLVKESTTPEGPGPNYFSGRPEDIWVDHEGLHLKIVQRDGRWYATECILQKSLGYGTYVIQTRSRIDRLDPNIILGLFTWETAAPQYHYRELDFEFSRWGKASDPTNAQFVVQPFEVPGNLVRYTVDLNPPNDPNLTMIMTWTEGKAEFMTYTGQVSPPVSTDLKPIYSWTRMGEAIPPAGGENFRFNLWLMDGKAPQSATGEEVLITHFHFFPITP
jgi:hypothetical protein